MGFFSDLKEDLSQAVNELMPEEELEAMMAGDAAEATKEETVEAEVSADAPLTEESLEAVDLSSMLDKLEGIEIPEEPEIPVESNVSVAAEPEEALFSELEVSLEQETIVEPEIPVVPEAFAEPEIPAEPAVFTEPEIPMEPEAFTEPEIPVEPEAFMEPESPAQAEVFSEPEISNEPETAEEYKEEAQGAGQNIMEELNVQEIAAELGTENVESEMSKGEEFKMDETRTASDETAVVTEGMSITGDIISEGTLELIGKVNGNIDILGKLNVTGIIQGNSKAAEIYAEGAKITGEISSQGSVKIGQDSVVIGNIAANSAVIAGAVKGDIDVHGPVILDTSAIVMGNIKSKSVQINNGAVIEGMCSQCYADVNPTSFFEDFKKKK